MENNFLCFTCQQKPIEFTILSCDHIICSACLQNRTIKKKDFLVVHCRCGRKTLSNEDSMLLSLKTPQMAEVKQELENMKFLENQHTRISNFIINESDITSKQNTFLRNLQKENVNTLNQYQKYTFNPTGLQYSKFFLKTEPLNLDESSPLLLQGHESSVEKQKIVKGVKSVQSIQSLSPSQKVSSKVSPRKRNPKESPSKKIQYSGYSTLGQSSDFLNFTANQLQKQLKYLEIQYKRQLQTCQKAFRKIKKSISSTYEKLITSIQNFYLNQAVELDLKQKDEMIFNIPKLVKKKYDSTVGKKIHQLGQSLLDYFSDYEQKKGTQREIQTRETAFFRKSAENAKENQLVSKSLPKKSRSKQKECALYLAISPKSKNDKIVNYIEVIRKDPSTKLSKKVNLSKKMVKNYRVRIY